MALPTNEELSVIETFRRNVADILSEDEATDDMFLIRWLRARDLDVKKAEDMLRNAMKWRKQNNLDNLIARKKPDSFFYDNFPRWTDGMDKVGRPIFSAAFGKWDVRKAVKEGRSAEFIDYLTDGFELLMKGIKTSANMHPPKPGQPPVTQMIGIFDWDGFAWGQLLSYQSVRNFLKIGSIYEAYYPEILHACYFINCPPIISTVLALLRPVIAPKPWIKFSVLEQTSNSGRRSF